jgi:coenzyme F420-reducing hydrogenase beta subunit
MVTPDAPRVVVVTKDGCHLCEDALAVVADVCDSLAVPWAPRDLATVAEPQRAQWTELIPVVLVDDEVHEVFRVDADRLRQALS